MRRYCDLHTHSHYSDGTFAPAEIVTEAAALGLSAVALTDHNTVAGLPEFLAAARGGTVQAIPGVEISTEYGEVELHIVGLFLPPDCFDSVTSFLDGFNQKKMESNRQLIHALNRAGYDLNYEEICRSHPEGTVNRATIAAALLEKGYVSSINDAFKGLLSKKSGYYVPPQRLSSLDAIDFLRSIGTVPVLAHPFLNLKTEAALRSFLAEAIPHGLAAMETIYSSLPRSRQLLHGSLPGNLASLKAAAVIFTGTPNPRSVWAEEKEIWLFRQILSVPCKPAYKKCHPFLNGWLIVSIQLTQAFSTPKATPISARGSSRKTPPANTRHRISSGTAMVNSTEARILAVPQATRNARPTALKNSQQNKMTSRKSSMVFPSFLCFLWSVYQSQGGNMWMNCNFFVTGRCRNIHLFNTPSL